MCTAPARGARPSCRYPAWLRAPPIGEAGSHQPSRRPPPSSLTTQRARAGATHPRGLTPAQPLPLARLGVFRLINKLVPAPLPSKTRGEERALTSTASLNRIQRDEFAELHATLTEAAALTTIGDRPLVVVTAVKGAQAGWLPLQDKMAHLSTNSAHRVLPDTDHPSVIHDRIGAAQSSQAMLDVVSSMRTGTPLAKA